MVCLSAGQGSEDFIVNFDEYDAAGCEAYGITLAEFLYDQEDLIHLNEAQKRHLDRWNLLTERQKRAVELFIDGLRQIG